MKNILSILFFFVCTFLYSQYSDTLTISQVEKLDSLRKTTFNSVTIEDEFFDIINEYRSKNNLSILVRDSVLDGFAKKQSEYMRSNKICSHKYMSMTFKDRVNGFKKAQIICENALKSSYTFCVLKDDVVGFAENVFDLWKNSPGHNSNMLYSDKNLKIGVSIIKDDKYGIYAVMVIGK
jgi:uncharacterized protein YkwD